MSIVTKKNREAEPKTSRLADIHTHILHSVDDGSSSVDESLELLKREKAQGVTDVVLTPHFDIERISFEDFIARRNSRYEELKQAVEREPELKGLKLYLGAEVAYNPRLINIDPEPLLISGTPYLLLELPFGNPFNLDETVAFFNAKGIKPILAHIERYDYLHSAKKLSSYKSRGILTQSNTSALLKKPVGSFIARMIKKGLIDVLASDTHNLEARPPIWDEALKKLKDTEIENLKANALEIVSAKRKSLES